MLGAKSGLSGYAYTYPGYIAFCTCIKTAIEHEITLTSYEISTDDKLSLWISAAEFNTLR
jgi:hypothetical protein